MTREEQNEAEYAMVVTELEHLLDIAKQGRLVDLLLIHSEVSTNDERLLILNRNGPKGTIVEPKVSLSMLIPCSESILNMMNVITNEVIPRFEARMEE